MEAGGDSPSTAPGLPEVGDVPPHGSERSEQAEQAGRAEARDGADGDVPSSDTPDSSAVEGERPSDASVPDSVAESAAESVAGSAPGALGGAEKLRQETEVESLLGPDVRTPVGIPKDYRPLESSLHDIFRVEFSDFAGPLDLLLYLIKKHDVDVFDIPIKFIADQYLALLDTLQQFPIDVAAEFLVLASELLHIKSKMLLPAKEGIAVENDEPEADPREELVRRLLEYQKYRDAANQLAERDQLGRDTFARVPSNADVVGELEPGLQTVSVFKLVELMAALVKTDELHHEISFESISIAERIEYICQFGEAREGRFSLTQLLQGIPSRRELVITFIAVLEMTRLGMIKLYMQDPEGERREAEAARAHPVDAPRSDSDGERPPRPVQDPPLPVILVVLTGKKMANELRDDYR